MKIFMITPFPPQVSGGSKASYYFYRYLKEIFNHQIEVMSYQNFQNNSIKVKNLGLKGNQSIARGITFMGLGFIRGLLYAIKYKPDVIYSKQLMTPSITAYFIAKCLRIPLVSHTAGPDIQDLLFLSTGVPLFSKIYYIIFSKLRLQVLKYSSAIVCNCRADYLALQKIYKNKKSVLIYNGVNYNKFKANSTDRKKIRYKYKIKDDETVIIYTGQANTQKQTDKLLIISQENPMHRFLIVGPTEDELLGFGSISKNIIVTGPILNNIEAYLSAADIFILPSSHEGLSNSILEALSVGLPIIVTPVGEAKYLINHKIHGILSKQEDFNKWINILLNDQSLTNILKKESRILVENKFNWKRSAKKMSNVLELVKKKNST